MAWINSGIRSGGTSPVNVNRSAIPRRCKSCSMCCRRIPVADQQEADLRTFGEDHFGRPQQEFMSLQRKQTRDLADDDVRRNETQFRPNLLSWSRRRQERVDVESAVNRRELLTISNARLDIGVGHGIRHGNKMGRSSRRPFLCRDVGPICGRTLSVVKRRPMHGVDAGDVRRRGRCPAENAGPYCCECGRRPD